jgi:hypothetical protein
MTSLFKHSLASLVLLVCLSASALASEPVNRPAEQAQPVVQQSAIGPLAWQRVGSPLSLHA